MGIDAPEGLRTFAETSAQVFEESALRTQEALDNVFDFSVSDRISQSNEELRAVLSETQNITTSAAGKINQDFQKIPKTLSTVSKQANAILKGGLVKSISGGIQTIVQSIAAGENAFANFGKFILNVFGDLAIQLGEFFIAQGIAVEALKAVNGAAAIAAGAGLIALGSILKSFGGGGAPAGATGGGGAVAGGLAESTEALDDPENFQERQVGTEVTINVEGSLVQQEELGVFIQDTLNEVNEKNGVIQVNTRVA